MKFSNKKKLHCQRGQTILEYVLVTTIVLGAFLAVTNYLKKSEFFFNKVTQPIMGYLRYNYKYADQNSRGWDEGSPRRHIVISKPNEGQTFRLFKPLK